LIQRLYIKDLLSFDEVDLEFDKSLVVLSGPSGAGKSLLISSILSSFGYSVNTNASVCELLLDKPPRLQNEAFNLDDELIIKSIKKDKLRYFINAQSISKKLLKEMFAPYIKYLSVRDTKGFESRDLIEMIDGFISSEDKEYKKLLKEYKKRYATYTQKANELKAIKENEAKIKDQIEFARYEIDKITSIDPKVGEYEELLEIKQQLSKIDKIKDAIKKANVIFEYEGYIQEVYRLLDKDISFFDDALNQLRVDFEDTDMLVASLEDVDIEDVLDRLSMLTDLKNRYGSIEDALNYKEQKLQEIAKYTNIEQDKSMLESYLALEYSELSIIAQKLSSYRKSAAIKIQNSLREYLSRLKIADLVFVFDTTNLSLDGIDKVDVSLQGSSMQTLSGGEFNRVRLALMAVATPPKNSKGILILDEIDANVSGDESIAIANLIERLSASYQIFAISHQPHLASKATQHILVSKQDGKSIAKVLDNSQRVEEISRIIAGENPTNEAVEFAKKLLMD
jgi:DNA repair protein RecN (Recombination protein N)